jgi:hypothetical protein
VTDFLQGIEDFVHYVHTPTEMSNIKFKILAWNTYMHIKCDSYIILICDSFFNIFMWVNNMCIVCS